MIISPPFVRPRNPGESDASWVNRMIPVDINRGFPLNRHASWHSGVHVLHTDRHGEEGYDRIEFVRAIADGVVLSFRKPSGLEKRDAFPLNYNGKTDDGYVLLKHETGIGENCRVVYYSLYMHLRDRLDPAIKAGAKIWRKDIIGQNGAVDGVNAFHFQVFCDDENMLKLTGRTTPELNITRDGRTDTLYGDIHFYLPVGTQFYDHVPDATSPATDHLNVVHTSTEPLYVSMTFEKGDCTMVTRRKKSASDMLYESVEDPLINVDHKNYEYALYDLAKKLYPQSPSAGFELLRFGRVVSTDITLTPVNAPLWRTVSFPGGKGLVNLASPDIKKFSDADFPHWTGWHMVDDDTDNNSQCNSPFVAGLQKNGHLSELADKLICHFPLEWNASTFDQRYAWLKKGCEDIPAMSETEYSKIKEHASALCFDTQELSTGRLWHFHPAAFISHFRKCGWLSKQELKQLVPMNALRYDGKVKGMVWEHITFHEGTATLAERLNIPLNRTMQKYLITTPLRAACFLGNAIQETQWLTHTEEAGCKSLWYYPWHGRGLLQLTNPDNYFSYFAFCGKTYPQAARDALVAEYNRLFENKDTYRDEHHRLVSERNHHDLSDPRHNKLRDAEQPLLPQNAIGWRNNLADSVQVAADSAGFYWLRRTMASYADEDHKLERCTVNVKAKTKTKTKTKAYYRSKAFWKASASVNLPKSIYKHYSPSLNGFEARCCVYGNAISVLTEMKFPDVNQNMLNEQPEYDQLRRAK